jgi:hypothetical protein
VARRKLRAVIDDGGDEVAGRAKIDWACALGGVLHVASGVGDRAQSRLLDLPHRDQPEVYQLCRLVGVAMTVGAVQAISAVVIGGVSIFGGSGSVYGAALGSVILAVLDNGVELFGINQFWLEAVIGAAILGTAMFYSVLACHAEQPERIPRQQLARTQYGVRQ